MRRLIGSTLVLLTLGAGAAAAQDAVLLRFSGHPGESTKYRTTVETWIRGGPMASMITDTTLPMQQMTMWQTRTLTAATADTLTWSEVIDSASAAFPAAPAMAQMANQVIATLRGMTTVSKTDRRGRVYSTQVTSGQMAGAGGQNSNRFFALPEGPVRPGDTWRDSSTVPFPGGDGATTYVVNFRLDRIDHSGGAQVAVVSITGQVNAESSQASSNMQIDAEVHLDVPMGKVLSLTMDMHGTSHVQAEEMPMRVHMVMQAL